ncbi:MAG TPA: helix-turn-helix domain-containing protein [Capillimicrobium sp.]|jgi:hypothetical protein
MEERDRRRLATVVARIERDALAERLLDSFRGAIAGYARLPEAVVRGQILDILRRNLELCLDWVATGREPTGADLAPFRESAKNRALEGMPLEDLLAAYRLGGRAGWRALVESAEGDERAALPLAAELVMEYVDLVSGTVAQAYLEERQHLVSEEERGLRALLDRIVAGAPLDDAAQAAAERIGFAVAGPHRAFAAATGGGAREHGRLAGGLRARGVLALTEGDRVAGLASAGGALPEPPDGALLVAGPPAADGELAEELEDVRLAVDLARRRGRCGLVALDELTLDLLVAAAPRHARRLRDRVLGPLRAASAGPRLDLAATIETYLAAGLDRRRAAEQLHVHPNTLDYRLRRAAELTGLDLGRPDDLAVVVLALRQRPAA